MRLKKLHDKTLPTKKYKRKTMYMAGTDPFARDLTDDELRSAYRAASVKYRIMGIEITPTDQVGIFIK